MKKVFISIATWIKSLFAKKSKSEKQKFPEVGTFTPVHLDEDLYYNDNSQEEKKQIIKKFNKNRNKSVHITEKWVSNEIEHEHKEVLRVTLRNKKPYAYDKSKNVEFSYKLGKILLTKKQSFFMDKILINQDPLKGVNANLICELFIKEKFKNPKNDQISPKLLKYDYHKTTFKYLLKKGLIEKVSKNYYKTAY